MRIFVMGTGQMGTWLVEELSAEYEVAVFDSNPARLEHFTRAQRLPTLSHVSDFQPQLVVNAVSLSNTLEAFRAVLPHLTEECILADIASVKIGLYDYYREQGRRFVSTHPMFGPTFGNVRDLREENAIIIKESDAEGKDFFEEFFRRLRLNIHEYTFEAHDRTIAYSLSVPFASSLVFAACMQKQEAPGTTFRKHLAIARGLLSEDDHLLAEILFNPHTVPQIEKINSQLSYLTHIIRGRDYDEMEKFLNRLRSNIQ